MQPGSRQRFRIFSPAAPRRAPSLLACFASPVNPPLRRLPETRRTRQGSLSSLTSGCYATSFGDEFRRRPVPGEPGRLISWSG